MLPLSVATLAFKFSGAWNARCTKGQRKSDATPKQRTHCGTVEVEGQTEVATGSHRLKRFTTNSRDR
ncbi:MAG: hypothetical protein QOD32_3559 [Pyrinomonadaceae bacterium]|jgi:hypothetical protein|nr:hypothetical protein [Pyrinomonadaceae bacterium]